MLILYAHVQTRAHLCTLVHNGGDDDDDGGDDSGDDDGDDDGDGDDGDYRRSRPLFFLIEQQQQ